MSRAVNGLSCSVCVMQEGAAGRVDPGGEGRENDLFAVKSRRLVLFCFLWKLKLLGVTNDGRLRAFIC